MKKIILITGAGSGIGKDTAFSLAARGHIVIATTKTELQAVSLQKEAVQKKCAIQVFKLDITDPLDREKITNYDLDVLINNAGVGETGSLAEVPIDRIRSNFEVNVFSTIELSQVALHNMMQKKRGTILFVSSLAGRSPALFLNPYSMTKYALSGGVAALRQEIHKVAKDVHISLIEPGAYATGFNQKMFAKKYEWMNENSYFYKMIPEIKIAETKRFHLLEQKNTKSIVRKIVKAVEAEKPQLRYVAPWYQGFGVFLYRMFGR